MNVTPELKVFVLKELIVRDLSKKELKQLIEMLEDQVFAWENLPF